MVSLLDEIAGRELWERYDPPLVDGLVALTAEERDLIVEALAGLRFHRDSGGFWPEGFWDTVEPLLGEPTSPRKS